MYRCITLRRRCRFITAHGSVEQKRNMPTVISAHTQFHHNVLLLVICYSCALDNGQQTNVECTVQHAELVLI